MRVCYVCGYWSRLSDQILGRPSHEYRQAYLYVYAVKYGTFLKDFRITNGDGSRSKIQKANIGTARRRFGSFVEQTIAEQSWGESPLLIAVPSRDTILGGGASRSSKMLQEAMAHTRFSAAISDGLRWKERLTEAHRGGKRGREAAKEHIVCEPDVSGRDIVLIDDLLTRGGTLLASKDILESNGANVLGAVTVGRTMYERDIKAFGRQKFELSGELDDFGRLVR